MLRGVLRWWFLCALPSAVCVLGCAANPRGASDASLQKARAKAPLGAQVYERECSRCHGVQGAGRTSAPEIMGYGALPEYRRIDSMSQNTNVNYAQVVPQGTQDPARTMFRGSRGKFVTAQDLFDYISTHMPLPASSAGTLKPEEYWAIVNFILVGHGAPVPAEGVTPANAKSVPIRASH